MSKRTEKSLNEKLTVKLPQNLSKENILEQLETSYQDEKIVENPKKKNTVKRLIPIAASFAVIIGLLSAYFGLGLGNKTDGPTSSADNSGYSDKTEVMRYLSYDKIYAQFDEMRAGYEKENAQSFFTDIFNFGNDFITEESAGDFIAGEPTEDMEIAPESSADDSWGASSGTNNSSQGSGTAQNKEFGTTNRQEEGVDEGDIIKTDGNYLYIADAEGKLISIVDIKTDDMKEISQIVLKDNEFCREIYIAKDRLAVIGFSYDENKNADGDDFVTYGCVAYESGDNTTVKIYDISDRTAPKLLTEYSQEGGYENSRVIGTRLYCISTYYVDIYDDDYRDNCIPETEINGVCEKVSAECIFVVEDNKSPSYAVITAIDIEMGEEPYCEAILGNCDELYASSKGLFLSETIYDKDNYEETTKIYRFEYTAIGVNYKCMGKVAGHINDQFSMSYDGNYFRIATTFNKSDSVGDFVSMSADNRVNNLYILNNNMQIVGKVEDLAKGESIESVRFVGNMAYVVTFRQTDPLFVIDLTDPENPTVKGELKIPGFSEYLHPIADGLLLGVGYDGTESGTNGDCKVSLFDVSNPYEPKETSVVRVTEGEGSVYNSVGINHKLFVRLSENEFAVPFNVRWFVHSGEKGRERGTYYIRYKLEDGEICELSRYYMCAEETGIMGATYAGNIFYAVVDCYNQGTCVISYDLTTNTEVDRVLLNEWE